MIELINKAWQKPSKGFYAVDIDRGSPLGNPWSHKHGTAAKFVVASREIAIEKYEAWLRDQLLNKHSPQMQEMKRIADSIAQGDDLSLRCWCNPHPCHGNVIIKIVREVLHNVDKDVDILARNNAY